MEDCVAIVDVHDVAVSVKMGRDIADVDEERSGRGERHKTQQLHTHDEDASEKEGHSGHVEGATVLEKKR